MTKLTPAQLAVIKAFADQATPSWIARALGVGRKRVELAITRGWHHGAPELDPATRQAIRQAAPEPVAARRAWTPAEDHYLSQYWDRLPARLIANKLGRTVAALATRAHDLGLAQARELLSLSTVAAIVGVRLYDVQRWVRSGLLGAERRPDDPDWRGIRIWGISERQLRQFLADYPEQYDAGRVQPPYQQFARTVPVGLQYCSVQQAARQIGVCEKTIRVGIQDGRLPARVWSRSAAGTPRYLVERQDVRRFARTLGPQAGQSRTQKGSFRHAA